MAWLLRWMLGYDVKKLSFTERDVCVCKLRRDSSRLLVQKLATILSDKLPKGCVILILLPGDDLMQMSEEDMGKMGWVRKQQEEGDEHAEQSEG